MISLVTKDELGDSLKYDSTNEKLDVNIDNKTITITNGVLVGFSIPAGFIMPFAGSTAPDGWLECNHGEVSRTQYADLYAAIGDTYGAGDGSTTFNLPENRGEFIRGWDNGRGIDPNRQLGSFQLDQLQEHNHNMTFQRDYNQPGSNRRIQYLFDQDNGAWNTEYVNEARSGAETRPRNVAYMVCIKY